MKNYCSVLFVLLLAAGSRPSLAQDQGEDFTVFLRRFMASERFRISRVAFPLRVTSGSSCENAEKPARWGPAAFGRQFTVPLAQAALAAQGLTQQITEMASHEVELFQLREEADWYLIMYTFAKRHGRWYLVRYEDASC